jgi:nicotinamidase/pyrazinamidase
MRRVIFFDVDTQYDFMDEKGKLYVRGAGEIIPHLRRLIRFATKNKILIVSSLDCHIIHDPEFKFFPLHCLDGSKGQEKLDLTLLRKKVIIGNKKYKASTLRKKLKGNLQVILKKQKIDVFSNHNTRQILEETKVAYVFGVALDYCVRSFCLGLA